MDSALLPHSDSGDDDTISIVAYGATPQPSEGSCPTNETRHSWTSPPSDIQTNYQPPDWNSDDGAAVDGSARRIAVHARSNSSRSSSSSSSSSEKSLPPASPPLPGGNSFRSTNAATAKPDPTASVKSTDLPPTPPASTKMRPLTLYGKDILHIFPFGTTSQDGNPVKWSDTLGAIDTEDDYSIRDPHFDLSNGKITKLFSLSNPDEEGMLSYEGFRCGLEAMGIACDSDRQFQAFVDVVDEDKNRVISYEEFLCAIQEIKLAQLFNEPFIRTMPALNASLKSPVTLGSVEYSPDRIRSMYPINQVKSFIYSTNPSWASVRWVNVEGINTLLMRRLSVRYRLHPLAIEDTLGPDVKRPKYVKFDEHSFLILQTLHPRDMATVKTYQHMYRASQFVLPEDASPFDSMSATELELRLKDLDVGRVMSPPQQLSLYVMEGVLISVQGANALWGALTQRLNVSYSKVRQHSTAFLMYTIMDVCVNELSPISQTFGAKLLMLERLMSLDSRYFDLRRIAACSKQIKGLQIHCKPMREVIAKLIVSDDYQGETLQYFADVQEHLTTIEEECVLNLDRCNSLVEEFNNARGSQQNDVSYILALIAAIFLPAQFLTGVYGMNFPYIPETTYYYGYFVWWAVMLVVAGLIVLLFKYKRWL
ncbi:methylated-DNA--protein-cysteine methyltransferase [Phytophthora pseudosyringae]|uniref:Methylated-DNA--protein-cysteine methyltransferase n=1 Tax=Phytophthora pseudosyringae TaxID=221518 RepID=A0A8T1VUQ3_9STRA|nr:methylated-DNA--protein-cysteine methyltransferase [Phytophthora pseudosyringae]